MKKTIKLVLGVAVAITVSQQSANSMTLAFDFFQGGYSEGAFIAGMYQGEDLSMDGVLVDFGVPPDDELSSFMVSFSGNSIVPAFTLTMSDLFGFTYESGTGDIGDDFAAGLLEGIGAIGTDFEYTTGEGPNGVPGGLVTDFISGGSDSTTELVIVTPKGIPVPEANATALLLSLSLFGFPVIRRYLI